MNVRVQVEHAEKRQPVEARQGADACEQFALGIERAGRHHRAVKCKPHAVEASVHGRPRAALELRPEGLEHGVIERARRHGADFEQRYDAPVLARRHVEEAVDGRGIAAPREQFLAASQAHGICARDVADERVCFVVEAGEEDALVHATVPGIRAAISAFDLRQAGHQQSADFVASFRTHARQRTRDTDCGDRPPVSVAHGGCNASRAGFVLLDFRYKAGTAALAEQPLDPGHGYAVFGVDAGKWAERQNLAANRRRHVRDQRAPARRRMIGRPRTGIGCDAQPLAALEALYDDHVGRARQRQIDRFARFGAELHQMRANERNDIQLTLDDAAIDQRMQAQAIPPLRFAFDETVLGEGGHEIEGGGLHKTRRLGDVAQLNVAAVGCGEHI